MRSNQASGNSATFTETARRAQLLRCAIEAIAESGYGRASLAEIARRAEVSKGVVSYYFAGKDELLGHVVADVYTRAGAAIGARLATEDDPAGKLRGYLEANLAFLREHSADIRAVVEIAANSRRPDGTLRFAPGDADPVLEHLAELLRAGQHAGEFRDFDPHSVALVIRGAIDTASGRLVTDPGFDLGTYTRELITLVELATRKFP
ncbi:TetR/AcrR family transcriptional regulator [Kocuria sp. CPCC 205300]|uniref:TetR/AcrR family transcriptional regulator n=1 Tax=Kocuria sabuli TaxID=3071448 RepID=UPI0036DBA7EB